MKLSLHFLILPLLVCCKENTSSQNNVLTKNRETIVYDNILINDNKAKSLVENGLNSIQNGDYDKAYKYFTEANIIESDNVIILNSLANIENIKEKIDDAENKYKKAIEIDSTYVISYVNYGKLLNKKKLYKEAYQVLTTGLKNNPTRAEKTNLYYNLTHTMVEIDECDKAKEYAILARVNSEFEEQKQEISQMIKGIELYCKKLPNGRPWTQQ